MSRSDRDRLRDIRAAIERVKTYQSSLGGEQSEMALSAILREIGIVGEAVNALPDDLIAKRPEIGWRQIAGMPNFLVHEYFNIDESIVEDVIKNDLDPLVAAVSALLDDAGT
ncbi:MAG: HepT-like ribonuclease domain-containing protein [Mycobacterium sp.]